MAVLRKSSSRSADICRLIKKINNVKEDPRRKTDSNFHFSQALLVLMRFYQEGMLCSAYNKTIFTPKEAEIGR